jgi:hypothetical protein
MTNIKLSCVTLWDIKENEKNSKFCYCPEYNGQHIVWQVLKLLTLPKKLLLVTSWTFAIKLLSVSYCLPFHFHPYCLLCSQNLVFTHTNNCRIMFLWIALLCCFLIYQLTSLSPDLLVICLSFFFNAHGSMHCESTLKCPNKMTLFVQHFIPCK